MIRPFLGNDFDAHVTDTNLSALAVVSAATWRCHMNTEGRILDVYQLKKVPSFKDGLNNIIVKIVDFNWIRIL